MYILSDARCAKELGDSQSSYAKLQDQLKRVPSHGLLLKHSPFGHSRFDEAKK